jgi:hypothetical protein
MVEQSHEADRRQHQRFELLAQVELRRGNEVATFTVLNISAGGVLLRNDLTVAVTTGEAIRLHLDVPTLNVSFSIDATVVRVVQATAKLPAVAAMWSSSDRTATDALTQLLWSLKR